MVPKNKPFHYFCLCMAEKELKKTEQDLQRAISRGAPVTDITNLENKLAYRQMVFDMINGID